MSDDLVTQWKEKYLASLDTLEKNQAASQAQLELLRRGLVRVSLAAEGLDATIDTQLEELRVALRTDKQLDRIESLLKRLEHSIVSLDDRRKDEHSDLRQLISKKLESVSEVGLSRPTKNKVAQFRKNLDKLMESNGINTELWHSFIHVQEAITENLLSQIEELSGNKEGLLTRLFRGKAADSTPNNHTERESLNLAESDSDTLPGQPGSRSAPTKDPTFIEADSHLQFNFRSNLHKLLDQLEVPADQSARKQSLIDQISQDFDLDIVPQFIEEATLLLTSTRISIQKEYEGFLLSLHQRLREVQEFLFTAREGEVQSKANQEKLDHDVREELKEIQHNVKQRSDLDQLKQDIEGMVSRIANSVDKFHNEEKERRVQVYERIETLANRMESMESEASTLKNSLEVQRLQALKDSLTELPNRASYDEHISNEYSRWKRHGRPLSLAIIDIDHFKTINDNLGHLRGDKVLKLVAREISRRVRKEDFVARYGGEEFVVILPETDLSAAYDASEKVRLAVADCPFNFNQQPIPVTASIGVAQFEPEDTIDACFERADKALYQAKRAGRNRVECLAAHLPAENKALDSQ